jgi:hypothetical protein
MGGIFFDINRGCVLHVTERERRGIVHIEFRRLSRRGAADRERGRAGGS